MIYLSLSWFTGLYDKIRIAKLRKAGLKIGKGVYIGENVIIDPTHCYLITIGDECTLSSGVLILAHDASMKRHINNTKFGKVIIGKKSFIGASSIILPGVRIRQNAIVGAGSVVTKDIPDNEVFAGNPAHKIKDVQEFIEYHNDQLQNHRCNNLREIIQMLEKERHCYGR